jgi:hypothetical protein
VNESKPSSKGRKAVSRVTLIAGGLVIAGSVLAVTVDMMFLLVFGLGVFGPGALREFGVLHDQDEFQREASRAAGYRAYLATGLFLSIWLAVVRRGSVSVEGDLAMSVSTILILLVVVWLLSALLGYWGAQKAASRILLVFGSFWLVFAILSHFTEPGGLLFEALVVAPFFLMAWTAYRWPRVTGVFLVALGIVVFFWFDLIEAFGDRMNAWPVILTMFLPLMACGLALLRVGVEDEGEPSTAHSPDP